MGATAVVARDGDADVAYADYAGHTYNGSMGGLQFKNNRADMEAYLQRDHPHMHAFRAQLYAREAKARYRRGTLLLYR